MSFSEVLDEIPRLTREQRREVMRCVLDVDATTATASEWRLERIDGRLLAVGPRVITQAEVDAILEDFP